MVIGKVFSKLIQAIPSWEVTKYYGRVCVFQLKCIKYRIQTSEAWFNFRCKFMPGSIEAEKSKPQKSETKGDPCEPQNKPNKSSDEQTATEISSKSRIWLPKISNRFPKDSEKSKEKKK